MEIEEKITKIAGMVYEVDPDYPDITYFAIIEEIKALVAQERAEIKEWIEKEKSLYTNNWQSDSKTLERIIGVLDSLETYLNHKNNKKENENV